MAVQPLTEQHIIFISPTHEVDENVIMSNGLVQTLADNAYGNALLTSVKGYKSWNNTTSTWTQHIYFEIIAFVTGAFQQVIQANMPNIQAAFPQFTVVTWGSNQDFGF